MKKTIAVTIVFVILVMALGYQQWQIVSINKELDTKLEDVQYKLDETRSIPLTQVVNTLMQIEMAREKTN